jgi:hypothetical protein
MMSIITKLTCDRVGCENSLDIEYPAAKNTIADYTNACKNANSVALDESNWVFWTSYTEKTTFTFCCDECCYQFNKERK